MDVELRRQLWAYVQELNAAGVTIVLTTHYLEEAQALCDRIAIVNHGRVVTNEPTRDLLRRLDTRAVVITPQSPLEARPRPPRLRRASCAPTAAWRSPSRPRARAWSRRSRPCAPRACGIHDLSTEDPDLEDVFLALTYGDPDAPRPDPRAGRAA